MHILGLNFKFDFFDFAKPKFMHCRMVVHFVHSMWFLGAAAAFRVSPGIAAVRQVAPKVALPSRSGLSQPALHG